MLHPLVVMQISFLINMCVVAVFAKGFYYSNPRYEGEIGLSIAGTKLEQVCNRSRACSVAHSI